MDHDEYGEITNGENTFREIATQLAMGDAVLIGWTDGRGTHFDFLFKYRAAANAAQTFGGAIVAGVFLSNNFQGGIRPSDLFVSIMRKGAFGFELRDTNTNWGYYDEKLGGGLGEVTGQAVADLINGIKKELVK